MKTIKVFLASSEELIDDRNAFGNLVRRLDKIYEKRGIRIELFEWEDYDAAYNYRRKQDEYNDQIKASDMFLALFHTKAGKFTIEEFDVATEEFKKKASPKVYTYCKDLLEGEQESLELVEFKRKLFKELGHYWCRYNNRDSMQLHFVMQLQLVETSGMIEKLKLEDGTVMIEGMPIAKIDNLLFAAGNNTYQKMRHELASLPEKIEKARQRVARFPNDEDLLEDLQQKLDRYNKMKDDFVNLQQKLFETAKRISSMQMEHVSDMLRHAIEAFDKGQIELANTILNEIAHEAEHHMELLDKQHSLIHKDIHALLIQAKTVMADASLEIEERINKTENIYMKAEAWAKKSVLPKEKYEILLADFCEFLYDSAQYDKVLPLAKLFVSIREDLYGINNLLTASAYNDLGQVLLAKGNFTDAFNYLKKSMDIRIELVGEISEEAAASFNNLGGLYNCQGNYRLSLDFYQKALRYYECTKDEVSIAMAINNIGVACTCLGEYDKALASYKSALTIRRRLFDEIHPDIAATYTGIGTIYFKKGDCVEAINYLSKARLIYERVFGVVNPATATCYLCIGQVYHSLGENDIAFKMLTQALKIREKVYGSQHVAVADSYVNLGLFYFSQENNFKAKECYTKALAIYKDNNEQVHPDMGSVYLNIANIYYSEGDLSTALDYNQKALEVYVLLLGEKHPNLAILYSNIGVIYDELKEFSLSLEFYFKALSIREEVLGESHLETASSYYNIGNFYFEHDNYEKALGYYVKVLEIYKAKLGADSMDVQSVIEKIDYIRLINEPKDNEEGNQIKCGFWSRFFKKK